MEKKVLTEINRIKEMMGLQLINEQTGELFFNALRRAYEKGGDSELNSILKSAEKSAESLGQNALKNRIRSFRETPRGNQGKQKLDRFMNDVRNSGFSDDVLKSIFEELPTKYISELLTARQVAEQTLRIIERNDQQGFTTLKDIVLEIGAEEEALMVIKEISLIYGITEVEAKELVKMIDNLNVNLGNPSKISFIQGIKANLSETEKANTILQLMGNASSNIEMEIEFIESQDALEAYIGRLKQKVKETTGKEIADDVAEEIIKIKKGNNNNVDQWVNSIKKKRLNPLVQPENLAEQWAAGKISMREFVEKTLNSMVAGRKDAIWKAQPSELGKIKNFMSNKKMVTNLITDLENKMSSKSDSEMYNALNSYIKETCESKPSVCRNQFQQILANTWYLYKNTCGPQKSQAKVDGKLLGRIFGTSVPCQIFSSIYVSWQLYLALAIILDIKDEGPFSFAKFLYAPLGLIVDKLLPDTCLNNEEKNTFINNFESIKSKIIDKDKKLGPDWKPIDGDTYELTSSEDSGCDSDQILVSARVDAVKTEPDVYIVKIDRDVENSTNSTYKLETPGSALEQVSSRLKKRVKNTEEKIDNAKERADSIIDVTKQRAERELDKVKTPLKPNDSGEGLGTGQGPGF